MTKNKWFDKLTTLSPVEGQYQNSNHQHAAQAPALRVIKTGFSLRSALWQNYETLFSNIFYRAGGLGFFVWRVLQRSAQHCCRRGNCCHYGLYMEKEKIGVAMFGI